MMTLACPQVSEKSSKTYKSALLSLRSMRVFHVQSQIPGIEVPKLSLNLTRNQGSLELQTKIKHSFPVEAIAGPIYLLLSKETALRTVILVARCEMEFQSA